MTVPKGKPKTDKATEAARKRYDRVAPFYDLHLAFAERLRVGKWRRLQWDRVTGGQILEVGAGTGKNFPFYPLKAEITAVDFSERMLSRAKNKARKKGAEVRLLSMDVQKLALENDSFDTVVSTFVFCSVPDPLQGLAEVKRVCKPGGRVILLEHVLSANPLVARLMTLLNPVVVRLMGANINRRTVENVAKSGLVIERVTDLGFGVFKLIESRKS